MPTINVDTDFFVSSVNAIDVPSIVEQLMEKLRHNIRADGEAEETDRLKRMVRTQEQDIASLRADVKEWREEHSKRVEENTKLKQRIDQLVRAGAPAPVLGEGEKQTVRDGNMIAAIKQLRQRIMDEHGYTLGLKEAKDLCDEYKRTLPAPPAPAPVPLTDDDARF